MKTRQGLGERIATGLLLCLACAGLQMGSAGGATVPGPSSSSFTPSIYRTYAAWRLATEQLPGNRANDHRLPPLDKLPLKTFGQFQEALDAFLDLSKRGLLAQTNAWTDWSPAHLKFFDTTKVYFDQRVPAAAIPFQPFAIKLALPANAEVIFHGDFHGDVRSLIKSLDWLNASGYLDGFQLTRPNLYMAFLGDFTDRGMQGVEVLYTLYRLKLANPERVFLVRGNHEDVALAQTYGFLAEGVGKYRQAFDAVKVMRAYDFMPVVLYVGSGTNFIQANHGGMEPGYDPGSLLDAPGDRRFQMLGTLNQAQFLRQNPTWLAGLNRAERAAAEDHMKDYRPESPGTPLTMGFLWSDFSILPGEPQLGYDDNRLGIIYGELTTKRLLEIAGTTRNQVRAVFRAHQHSSLINPMMRRLKASNGIFRHWQEKDGLSLAGADEAKLKAALETAEERPIPIGSVWTFNVSPDTYYGEGCDFNFDTIGILKLAERFEDWRLRVVNVVVPWISPSNVADRLDSSNAQTRPESSGTGFFVTDDGYLITNEHVTRNGAQVRVVTAAGLISAKVVKVDAANDLALLKVEGRFAALPIVASRTVKLGGTVATVGFPNPGLQGFAPKLAKGEIASLSGAQDDPRYFQISVAVQPGNSGGALVDERGNVVGIVSAKLDARAAVITSGALPENVNYAVKSSFLLGFLESVPELSAKLKEPKTTAAPKFEEVVHAAEQAAVLVLVY